MGSSGTGARTKEPHGGKLRGPGGRVRKSWGLIAEFDLDDRAILREISTVAERHLRLHVG